MGKEFDLGQCKSPPTGLGHTWQLMGKVVGKVYRVRFFKTLFDSTGHRADPCQGTLEVRGVTRDDAVRQARHRFAELKGITRRSLYADFDVVEELPARKRTSRSVWRSSLSDHVHCTRHP